MNRVRGILVTAGIFFMGLAGCTLDRVVGGTGAGNPPQADVALSFQASSAASPTPATVALSRISAARAVHSSTIQSRNPDGSFSTMDSLGTALRLTAIDVKVGRIDFHLPDSLGCEQVVGLACVEGQASVKGPYSMDLMSGKSVPDINFIKLPPGLYHNFDLEVPGADDSLAAKDTLSNMSIGGEIDGPGGKRIFELRLNLQDGLDFRDSVGVRLSAGAINHLVLSLNVDDWFSGTDMGKCMDDSAGAVIESGVRILKGDSTCSGTGLRIRRNIEASSGVENKDATAGP